MAEFNLGRIRFVWKDTWADTTPYVVDDVVQYNGKTYICVVNHTSNNFDTDLNDTTPKWNLMADGVTWGGDWTTNTTYDVGTIVRYGGLVYICKTTHTSAATTTLGLEANSNDWDTFATSFYWAGNWAGTTRYRVNDLVKYGGYVYICNEAHTSQSLLESDDLKWDVLNAGLDYKGNWTNAEYYKINDIVKYGADLWICNTAHTASAGLDPVKFTIFVNGFQFESSWSNSTTYQVGDIVTYGGYTYVALQNHTNENPSTATSYWSVFTTGFKLQGDWSNSTTYKIGDVVRLGGYTYFAVADNQAQTPPNPTYWAQLNSGLKWRNTSSSYSAVASSNISATGSGSPTFDVTRNNAVYTVTIHTGAAGTGYTVGDTLKILGTAVGGQSPVNDITITVATITGGGGTGPIGTVTATGIAVTWTSGTSYVLGDVVLYSANSYVCVSAHTAESGNRPDADTIGTYWNLLTAGAESAQLIATGDTFYYSSSGPARLPIGQDGQILRVSNGLPSWGFFGQVNNLIYVSPQGTDRADFGNSPENPLKTIRYACQIVEDGYLNQNAAALLTKNKQFIIKEVNNYISYTYKVSVTGATSTEFTASDTSMLNVGMPIRFSGTVGGVTAGTTYYVYNVADSTHFSITNTYGGTQRSLSAASGSMTGSFVYDAVKAERDAGLVLDGIIFDLGHGGTLKTTTAATSFFNVAGTSYVSTNTGIEMPQFIAAQSYLATLIGYVLGNTAPGSNYQTLNSVSPTADQIIDTTLTAETGSATTASSLMSIITTGLTAGATSAIPTAIQPNTTISAKTGTYTESLPIVLPAYTAIVGDELRSTVVQPVTSDPLLATVVPKTQAALSHIRDLVPDLMANNTISPTSGNTVAQVKTLPAATTGSSIAISNLQNSFNILYELVAAGLGGEPAIVMPSPTGYNTNSLVNTAYATTGNSTGDTTSYGYGVAQIRQNYAFIVAEVLQYFSSTYPAIYSAEGASGPSRGYRDIAFILDSVLYDMTYGGNYQSNIAGSAYYSQYVLQILSTEKAPFIDILGRMKTIVGQIAQKTAVTVTLGNDLTQNTSGNGGNAYAGSFAQDRIQNVINWITNGIGDASIATYTGWTSSTLQTAYSALTGQVSNIQSDAVVWCKKFYQSVNFDSSLASRDAGLIINSLAYDMIFGSNFNAIQAGRAFNRANTSATTLRSGPELPQTLGAINFMFYKAKQIAASGAAVQIQTTIDDINNYLDGGVEPPVITWTQPSLPIASYTGVTGTVLSGGGNGSAAFTITRSTNGNGYYNYVITPTTAGASYTTSSKIKILGTSIGGATPTNDIVLNVTQVSTGGVVAVTYSDPLAAVGLLESNRLFVLAEVIAYINANYSSITTNPNYTVAKTQRDANYILDAVHFDLVYGGTWASNNAGMAYYSALYGSQISTGLQTAFSNTVDYISTLLQSIVVGTAIGSPLQANVEQVLPTTSGMTGAAKDATQAAALITIIKNFIDNGLTTGAPTITVTTIATNNTFTSNGHGLSNGDIVIPQTTTNGLTSTIIGSGTPYYVVNSATNTFQLAASYSGTEIATFTNGTGLTIKLQTINMPYLGWADSTSLSAYTTLSAATSTYQSSVVTYLNTNYASLTYNSTYAQRDVFNVTLATMLDTVLGSNFASIQAGRAYNRTQDYQVLGYEKIATVASLNYLETLIATSLSSFTVQLPKAQTAIYFVINMLQNGSGTKPEYNGTVTYNNTLGTIKGAEILRANIPFLAQETVAYYSASFGGTVSNLAASGNLITTSANHKFVVNDPIVFSGTSAGGITTGTVYYVKSVPSTTSFTITTSEGYLNTNTGSVGATVTLTDVSSPVLTVAYYYNATKAKSDITYFLNAIIYDLQFTGNYKSLRSADVLLNTINGSTTNNMFLVRNGSGLRNMTFTGLNGTLTNPNSYNTKRPTAGAYVSLDPGFGPNDTNVWITSRSCYAQNITMFGTACIGAKIDGALHNGGNRSTVHNDFTTILSDGIGVWCTGSNALTELISVFNYYGYAGYLSELGGRIRAANGNSSYGTYGVIAEGVDTYEVPITATLNNRAYSAQITNTITDGVNQILRFEYANAGSAYTNTVHTISGSGYNAAAIADEFRDAAVFETRLTDNGDGTSTSVGGTSYVSQSNAAQTGSIGQITIANTDTALSTAYLGMRMQITAGTGVGQYGNILSYNNGTKISLIIKDSFTTLTVTNTAITNNLLTVASTASLYVGMPIYLDTTVNGLTANTLYYIISANFSATQFSVSTSSGGSAVTISGTSSGLTIKLYAAGWDHVIPGSTITNNLDLTSTYIIEPRIQYSSPGYTSTARTLSATATWSSATYGANKFVAIASGGTSTSQSADGLSWTNAGALPASTTWGSVVYVGGEGATATAVVGGLGGSGAVLTAVLGTANSLGNPQADQVASVIVVNGGVGYTTPPTIVFTSGSGANATATCTVRNGAIASVTVTVNGSGYLTAPTVTAATDRITAINVVTQGKNYTNAANITVSISGGGGSNAQATAAINANQGVSQIILSDNGTGYTSTPTVVILDTNAKYVAIANTSNNSATQTVAGLVGPNAWSASGSTSKTDLAAMAYGNGVIVAVGGTSGTGSVVSSSDFGGTWTDRSSTVNTANPLSTGAYTDVAYGNGVFVAINGGGGQKTSYSTNGTTSWNVGGDLPFTTAVSIAYGNGRFVVMGSDGALAYSLDKGATWVASLISTGTTTSILSSSYTWTTLRYGQGQFMAISQSTVSATSPSGINWTVRAMPGSTTNWKALVFGNPNSNPIWVAASSSSGTIGASIRTGATTLGRMKVTSNVVSEIRLIEPGSGYPKGTITATTGGGTNTITVSDTTNLIDSQPIEFTGCTAGGLALNTTYYVIGSTIVSNTSFKVSTTAGSSTPVTLITATGLTGTYRAGPIVTQTDPNKIKTATTRVRLGDGALGNPSFSNRGSGNTTATATTSGDGYADLYQNSAFVSVSGLFTQPTPGANIQFASIPNVWYKLVSVTNVLGIAGNYTATFQVNPALTTANAPAHADSVTTRLKYSQVRLTGHDFLYIGTGGIAATNYPNVDPTKAIQANQTNSSGGGRVFFTSTDQDGNFNVGNLFGVQQATGTATLNATAFNLAGLQSLQLGAVSLGVGSAIITQFSTDPYFTANSDNILPTQKAVKAYITSQIGGGASTLNVNTLTSGVIYISGNTITTTTGVQINITSKMNFTGGIDGSPVALAYFTQH